MSTKKPSKREQEFAEKLHRLLWNLKTFGDIERAAGVTDRQAWWLARKHLTIDQGRDELHELIADRLRKGIINEKGGAA